MVVCWWLAYYRQTRVTGYIERVVTRNNNEVEEKLFSTLITIIMESCSPNSLMPPQQYLLYLSA